MSGTAGDVRPVIVVVKFLYLEPCNTRRVLGALEDMRLESEVYTL